MKNKEVNRKSVKSGIFAGFLGSLCCTIPLILIAFGLASFGVATKFIKHRPFFVILGVVFLLFALYRQIKKKHGTCNKKTIKQEIKTIIVAIITALIIWLFLIYVLVPFILNFYK